MIRNCITVAISATKLGNNAKVFEMTSKWRHVANNYSKFKMKISSKLGSFQNNEGQIRNQWRQIYLSEHIHREYNNFFQSGMVPLISFALFLIITILWRHVTWCWVQSWQMF